MLIGVGILYRILYCLLKNNLFYLFKCKLLQSNNFGWGRDNFFWHTITCTFVCFCSEGFPLPLDAKDVLCYFIVVLLHLPDNDFRNSLFQLKKKTTKKNNIFPLFHHFLLRFKSPEQNIPVICDFVWNRFCTVFTESVF